jgi:nucleoside-diphosphate-sugar epimerase
VSEKQRVCPQSIYAAHKLCVEHYLEVYAAKNAITFTTCRIANAYGPDPTPAGRGYKILNAFVVQSLAGNPITLFGTGEQIRDFIYVEDLAALLVRCCYRQGSENQVFNVGSGTPCRLVDAARIIRDLTNGPPLRFQPWPAAHLAVESGDYCSDITKARKLLGFSPRHSLLQGIADTVRFHRPERLTGIAPALPHTQQLPPPALIT